MQKKIILCLYFVLTFSQFGTAQVFWNSAPVTATAKSDTNVVLINHIEIIGNEITKAEVILRELLFSEGEKVRLNRILAAQKRILNTGLFTQVQFDIVGDPEFSALLISVYERWYIYPIPLFYLNERSWKKISYGFQLLYYNFLGRDILLNFTAAFGYNPQFKIAYYNPWFFGDLKLFTNFMMFKGKVKAKSVKLNGLVYNQKGIDWLIGKRFGHFTYLALTFHFTEIANSAEKGLTLSTSGKDIVPSITISFQFDDRDLQAYPHHGWKIQFWTTKVGSHKPVDYFKYGADLRNYYPINQSLTLASRCAANLTSGKIPLYDRSFFGYEERIRGRFYDVYEGENLIFGGVELRFPIFAIRYIDVPQMPGFEKYSKHLKFGLSGGLFYDAGAVWFQDQELTQSDFKSGFGAGLHFHLPYIDVFRVELGCNQQWKTQAIAEVETAF